MSTAAAEKQTYRWTAKGFTEDINQCERCGKPELKGTVRMVSVDADGDEGDTVFMGVSCAARMSGRKAEEIRHEAKEADKAAAAELRAAAEKRNSEILRLRDVWLAECGHDIRRNRPAFEGICEALDWAKAQVA